MISLLLLGLYSQGCVNGLEKTQEFSGNQSVYSEMNFSDRVCEKPALISRSYGSYELGGAVAEPAGARAIDFTFSRVTLEPLSEAVAENYRARALCGLESWRAGEETEITGLPCDFLNTGNPFPVPVSGSVRYGIIQQAEEGFFFGRLSPERPALSPATRPRELEERQYRKVIQ